MFISVQNLCPAKARVLLVLMLICVMPAVFSMVVISDVGVILNVCSIVFIAVLFAGFLLFISVCIWFCIIWVVCWVVLASSYQL